MTANASSGVVIWSSNSGMSPVINTGTTYSPVSLPLGVNTFYILDTTAQGCKSATKDSIVVTVNPTPTNPVVSAAGYTYCTGQSISTITATASTGTIVWSTSPTMSPTVNIGGTYNPTGLPLGTTTYYLTDTTATGCKSAGTTSVSVTMLQTPAIPLASPNATYCSAQTINPLTATGGPTIVWYSDPGMTQNVNTGNSYTPVNPAIGTTTYYLVDSSANGCKSTSSATVSITINQTPGTPTITTTNNVYCQGQTISALNANGSGGTIYWSTSPTFSPVVATGNSYSPVGLGTGTTVYYLYDSSSNGCKSIASSTVSITINPSPLVNGGTLDSAFCGGGQGGVHGLTVSGGTPIYHYQWYNAAGQPIAGDTTLTLANQTSGGYSLSVIDANGCTALLNTSFTVPGTTNPVASFTPTPSSGQAPLPVTFTNGSAGATAYIWNFGANTGTSIAANPSYEYTAGGTYTVDLVATNGNCKSTYTATIVIDAPTTMIIPNIFSPNGDGTNDQFFIITTGMNNLTCNIFNRWGQLVYELTAPNQRWDGTLNNGNLASEGTYFFILNAVGFDGKTYNQQGSLTLVR